MKKRVIKRTLIFLLIFLFLGCAVEAPTDKSKQTGIEAKLIKFDVSNCSEVLDAITPVIDKEGPFYGLVNNAGITKDSLFIGMKEDQWDAVLSVNLKSFYNVTRPVVKSMLSARTGRVVSISSVIGQAGNAGQVNYSASKGALISATKSLAQEVAKRNVLVNAIAPGFIETPMTEKLPKEQFLTRIPLNRFGQPEDVANVVSFLFSDKASYITGQVLNVNGGMYM